MPQAVALAQSQAEVRITDAQLFNDPQVNTDLSWALAQVQRVRETVGHTGRQSQWRQWLGEFYQEQRPHGTLALKSPLRE